MAQYNYDGYHMRILHSNHGNYDIPEWFIAINSFVSLYSNTDLDAWRDANNVLHRESAANPTPKVEFNTPYIDSKKLQDVWGEIRKRYTNANEKKLRMKVWIEELNDYVTQYFYLTSDVTPTVYCKKTVKEIVGGIPVDRIRFIYNPIRFAFIGYGA